MVHWVLMAAFQYPAIMPKQACLQPLPTHLPWRNLLRLLHHSSEARQWKVLALPACLNPQSQMRPQPINLAIMQHWLTTIQQWQHWMMCTKKWLISPSMLLPLSIEPCTKRHSTPNVALKCFGQPFGCPSLWIHQLHFRQFLSSSKNL